MKSSYLDLIAEAEAEIEVLTVAELKVLDPEESVIVDVRDVREREREGYIPAAIHAPRGMLEFWVDPASPYHKEVFASGKRFVFYCSKGWRSALATQTVQRMGLGPVAHLAGGFEAWREAGEKVEGKEQKGGQ